MGFADEATPRKQLRADNSLNSRIHMDHAMSARWTNVICKSFLMKRQDGCMISVVKSMPLSLCVEAIGRHLEARVRRNVNLPAVIGDVLFVLMGTSQIIVAKLTQSKTRSNVSKKGNKKKQSVSRAIVRNRPNAKTAKPAKPTNDVLL
jgi:hypothetical protein